MFMYILIKVLTFIVNCSIATENVVSIHAHRRNINSFELVNSCFGVNKKFQQNFYTWSEKNSGIIWWLWCMVFPRPFEIHHFKRDVTVGRFPSPLPPFTTKVPGVIKNYSGPKSKKKWEFWNTLEFQNFWPYPHGCPTPVSPTPWDSPTVTPLSCTFLHGCIVGSVW